MERIIYEGDGTLEIFKSGVKREHYSYHFRNIDSVAKLKATIRAGKYSFPGGYPLFLLADDGAPICFDCAREDFRELCHAMRHKENNGFRIVACEINYEDLDCQCAHCGNRIECAIEE